MLKNGVATCVSVGQRNVYTRCQWSLLGQKNVVHVVNVVMLIMVFMLLIVPSGSEVC